jgi:SAM-dependent methyltransferase
VFRCNQSVFEIREYLKRVFVTELAGFYRVSTLGLGLKSSVRVLDLGSGKGGAARHLASTFGCHVTCYNLGKNQNSHNLKQAKADGIGHLVECRQGNFNAGLPAEWTASFDLVWSQEALCHAKDQLTLLTEIKRVLKPGGAAIFTDIMRTVRLLL